MRFEYGPSAACHQFSCVVKFPDKFQIKTDQCEVKVNTLCVSHQGDDKSTVLKFDVDKTCFNLESRIGKISSRTPLKMYIVGINTQHVCMYKEIFGGGVGGKEVFTFGMP